MIDREMSFVTAKDGILFCLSLFDFHFLTRFTHRLFIFSETGVLWNVYCSRE